MIRSAAISPRAISIVEVAYPAPIFDDLDDLLKRLAESFGGNWFGSGVGLVTGLAERDIEFHFDDEISARDFARKTSCIIGVRVLATNQ
jgi:hypothetical protein